MITLKEFREKAEKLIERNMTSGEKKKREDYVKGMKKSAKDFKNRYGKDAKSVMYATATKMAMNESRKKLNIPVVMILKRKALRMYPDGHVVAMYHADKINKVVTIPFSTIGIGDATIED